MKYCPELFHNIYVEKIQSNQLQIANCCLQPRSPPTHKIDFNHEFLHRQREFNLIRGTLPKSCKICIDLENNGVTSRRLQLVNNNAYNFTNNAKFIPKLKRLNYNCENICNLKCITCSSFNSSAWVPDEKKLGFPIYFKGKNTRNNKLTLQYDFDGLEIISFNGGEPLMTVDHQNILEYLIEHHDTKNIEVEYNTNATAKIDEKTMRQWEKFKLVSLACSIDGIKESFDYIRFPANWSEVATNIKEYQSLNLNVTVSMTLGLHNVLYVEDVLNWANENSLYMAINHCQGILELKNWPLHLKSERHWQGFILDNLLE